MKKIFAAAISAKDWIKSRTLKIKIALTAGVILLSGIIYLSLALVSISPEEISLAELRESWNKETVCHETCSRARKLARAAIVSGLQAKPDSRLAKRIKADILDEQVGDGFKIELIKILSAASARLNPPEYLRKYLADSSGHPAVQAAIIDSYEPTALAWSLTAETTAADYYLDVISGERDIAVRLAALRALSNYQARKNDFSISQLERIKKIIFDPATDKRLRPELVMLLGDYYELFPSEAAAILRTFYKTEADGDEVSRAFAADILNRNAGDDLKIPEIPDSQWAQYYNY